MMRSITRRPTVATLMLARPPFEVLPLTVFCATCGHSDFIHSDFGHRPCIYAECDCNAFVVGAFPKLSTQVFP